MKFISKMTMLMALCLSMSVAFGQTTASFVGEVVDTDGGPLPGAVVAATHEPTGTRYNSVTRADGRFNILNVRVGGPYTFTVTMTGFRTQKQSDIYVKLGETKRLSFTLQLDTVEETLVVVASSNEIINPSHTGATSNVTAEQLEKLPTITRSFSDFTRTSPYFNSNRNFGSTSVSGRNNRYNNIQIDGAANTDLFGLAGNNTPGGQTGAQPISIDAIQELELVVSPYDVRQGGFTGGGINAITRSGTNGLDGSVFGFFRDQDYVGDGPSDTAFGEFKSTQVGFRVGGPIKKDKVFYFVSYEDNDNETPSDWLIDGSGNNNDFGNVAAGDEFLDIIRGVWGHDPGGYGEFTRKQVSENFFVRFDFNINDTHRLTARHNFVESSSHSFERSSRRFEFPDAFYQIEDETNSTVFQLNSTFGKFFNEARLTLSTIKDRRAGPSPFPQVTVDIGGGSSFRAGTEQFSTANSLDQDIIEINNELTFFVGRHNITLGTHNEFISFKNLFIQDSFGTYAFNSLDDFRNGYADRYDYSFSNTSDPLQTADVDVMQLGLYAGDEWEILNNLNITYGVRVDIPYFDNPPSRNPDTERLFGRRTDEIPDGNALWSPRVGFNWDIKDDGKSQLRGGIGIFSGRPIYVWLSNNFSNTGVEFTRVQAFAAGTADNHIPFNPDPNSQPSSIGGAVTTEYNLVDPDFKYPQVLRTSIGYDQEFDWLGGFIGTVEYVYTDNLEEILYKNLNLQVVDNQAFDGRPIVGPVDSSEGNAYFLTNTESGWSSNATLQLERPSSNGFGWSFAYTNNNSRTLLDGTSSRAVSNFNNLETKGDSNNNQIGTSDFETKHRYLASVTYTKDFWKGADTSIAMFYNLRSGRPYSTTYYDDVNGDRNRFNDLLYVPGSADEVIVVDRNGDATAAAADAFWAYINGDSGLAAAKGTIVDRNASEEPWNSLIDLRIAQDIPIHRYQLQISLDIQNFGNLLDKDSGTLASVNFGNNSVVGFNGYDDATGKAIYEFTRTPDGNGAFSRTALADQLSRWYAKLGVRFNF